MKRTNDQIQLVFVFTVTAADSEELLKQKLTDLADAIQDSVEISFEDDARDTVFLDVDALTHLILRRLQDGDEKETVARNYVITEDTEETNGSKNMVG